MSEAIQKALAKARHQLREPRQQTMRFSVPLVPPSVNHYKRPKASGKGFYVTEEAKAFKAAVACLSKGSVEAKEYFVGVLVFFGKGQRGDVGNLEKCIGDGLQDAGIIGNDAKIKKYQIEVSRDWDEPRTEIFVCPLADAPVGDWWSRIETVRRMAVESGIDIIETQMVPTGVLVPHNNTGPCRLHGAAICRQCGGDGGK